MPSSYTARNRLEKQGAGENSNTWGTRLNTNVIDLVDFALDGVTAFSLSSSKTLSDEDGAADEARARVLHITSGSGGTVTIPDLEKVYLVINDASGPVTITTGSGTSAEVAAGESQWVVSFGSDVVRATLGSVVYTTGPQTLGDKTLTMPVIDGIAVEDTYSITDGAGFAVDPANGGVQRVTLGANRTPDLSAITAGKWVLLLVDDGSGYTITLSGVTWMSNDGSAPALKTSGYTAFLLMHDGASLKAWHCGDVG